MIQEKGGKTLVSLRQCQESLDGGEGVSEMSALQQETRKMVLGRSEGAKPDLSLPVPSQSQNDRPKLEPRPSQHVSGTRRA